MGKYIFQHPYDPWQSKVSGAKSILLIGQQVTLIF
jgi:hypothetical protein